MLDEPTASLDIAHQVVLINAIGAVADGGAGVLVALPDLNLAAVFSGRVALLSEGRIAALGTPVAALKADCLSEVY